LVLWYSAVFSRRARLDPQDSCGTRKPFAVNSLQITAKTAQTAGSAARVKEPSPWIAKDELSAIRRQIALAIGLG
jgi:hypothetical protein